MRATLLLLLLAACSLKRPADVPDPDAPPATFAVGGVVASMWPGASVELRLTTDSSSETLVRSANGQFAFAARLVAGTSYHIEISTPPADHTCTVTNGVGAIETADISNVIVDCRAIEDIELSLPIAWQLDPAKFDDTIPISILGQETTVTVRASRASSIMINGSIATSGVASPPIPLPKGPTTITVTIALGAETHTYTLTINRGARPIEQYAYIKASNTDAGDQFGAAIALHGEWLAVGAPGEDSNATTIDGDTGNNSCTDCGAVYLFHRTRATWKLEHYVKAWAIGATGFGTSLAFSDDHLLVGTTAGKVFAFTFQNGTLAKEAIIVAANGESTDSFGAALSLDGDILAVGAPREDSAATTVNGDETDNSSLDNGAAYFFHETTPGSWTQEAYLKTPWSQRWQAFGASVFTWTYAGDRYVAVGVPGYDDSTPRIDVGAVVMFLQENGGWTFMWGSGVNQNEPPEALGGSLARAASSTSIPLFASGSGAPLPGTPSQVGTVKIGYGPGGLVDTLVPSQSTFGQRYGAAIGIAGNMIAAGAPSDFGTSIGIDDPAPVAGVRPDSGAVFLFDVQSLEGTQLGYIKATNPRRTNEFGNAVGFAMDELLVAAQFDGNQFDVSAFGSGAIYAFR
jgi:hypothetical protein